MCFVNLLTTLYTSITYYYYYYYYCFMRGSDFNAGERLGEIVRGGGPARKRNQNAG